MASQWGLNDECFCWRRCYNSSNCMMILKGFPKYICIFAAILIKWRSASYLILLLVTAISHIVTIRKKCNSTNVILMYHGIAYIWLSIFCTHSLYLFGFPSGCFGFKILTISKINVTSKMDHKREGHSFALIISAVIFAILSSTSNATLYVIKDAPTLRSSDFPLIGNTESIDVLWLFDHSVRLSLNKFHLNGHAGDFVLVSDQPLLKPDLFQNGTSEDVYIDNLANSILTDQGLLISWKTNKTIEAVNRKGTFVLFHSEPKDPAWTGKFDGFEIVVQNYGNTFKVNLKFIVVKRI